MASQRVAIVLTDAISANRLMAGQLEYLKAAGARIDIYTGGSADEITTLDKRGVGEVRFVPFHRQPRPLQDLLCLIRLTRALAESRFDAVIYSTPKAMLLGSLAALLSRQPNRIALVRGRAYEHARGAKRRLFLLLDRITFACSHQVLFVSKSLAEAYRSDGIFPQGKGQVVGRGSSNGVDVDRFRPPSADERLAARRRIGVADDQFLLVTIGRINPDKGIREIIEVARTVEPKAAFRFLLVGPVEDQPTRELLRNCGLRNLSVVEGFQDPKLYFWAADAHLFLSHREGLPNVVLEAAASGLPTIGFDAVGVRDVIVDGVTGRILPFGDVDAVVHALGEAWADRQAFRERYAGARQFICDHYKQALVWQRYAELSLGRRVNSS